MIHGLGSVRTCPQYTEPVPLQGGPITRTSVAAWLLAVVLPLSGCTTDQEGPPGARAPGAPGGETSSPTPVPGGEGGEAPTEQACVNGWTEPEDREQRELPFHVIRRTQKVDGEFDVVEMRYFEGPESPPSIKGYLLTVDRWYVKAELQGDPTFRGRWLIEERAFGSGVVAVAPFDSEGFASPDWIGFQYEGEDAKLQPRSELDLPGRWAGRPYDFVAGRDLETGGRIFSFPGLPPQVAGCLEGT